MAIVSKIATLKLSATVGGDTVGFRQWQASAAVQDTATGSSVSITTVQTSGGVPPGVADTLTLQMRDSSGAAFKTFTLTPGSASQNNTFYFNNDGNAGGPSAARNGTVSLTLRATKTTGGPTGTYDIESDGAPNTPPTAFSTVTADQGFIRSTDTATMAVSNVSLGGAKTSPAEYDESLFVRTVLTASLYVGHTTTTTMSGATPALSGTAPGTSATRDVTFSNVTDNRFTAASQTSTGGFSIANSALGTGLAEVALTVVTDNITVDPRLTIPVQAQRTGTRTDGGNQTVYVIAAHELYLWARVQAARGTNKSGITLTQRLMNGATQVLADTTKVTGADGWTPASTPPNFTSAVQPPEGNRTQDCFPNAPAEAVGLGTGTQTLGFNSPFTADKAIALTMPDEVPKGEASRITLEYLKADGTRLALDAAPQLRIYSLTAAGVQTDAQALTAMAQFSGQNAWYYDWTPAAKGQFMVEARPVYLATALQATERVQVRDKYTLALGKLVNRM